MPLEDCAGCTELYDKNIYINIKTVEDASINKKIQEETLRHEIVHAFLYESGLNNSSDWARNEEIVDWIAVQGLKIVKAWKEAGVLKCDS